MSTISALLYRYSSWTLLAVITLGYGLFLALVMTPQAATMTALAGPWGAPDGHFFYTPEQLYAELDGWNIAAQQAYVDFRLGLDPVWALIYGSFLLVATSLALNPVLPEAAKLRMANLSGAVPMCADLLENLLGIALVSALPDRLDALALFAAIITSLKWSTLLLAHGVLLLAMCAAAKVSLERRFRKSR